MIDFFLKNIKKLLTDKEIEALKTAYKNLDVNSDGVLTKQEFQAVLNYNASLQFNEANMQLNMQIKYANYANKKLLN